MSYRSVPAKAEALLYVGLVVHADSNDKPVAHQGLGGQGLRRQHVRVPFPGGNHGGAQLHGGPGRAVGGEEGEGVDQPDLCHPVAREASGLRYSEVVEHPCDPVGEHPA